MDMINRSFRKIKQIIGYSETQKILQSHSEKLELSCKIYIQINSKTNKYVYLQIKSSEGKQFGRKQIAIAKQLQQKLNIVKNLNSQNLRKIIAKQQKKQNTNQQTEFQQSQNCLREQIDKSILKHPQLKSQVRQLKIDQKIDDENSLSYFDETYSQDKAESGKNYKDLQSLFNNEISKIQSEQDSEGSISMINIQQFKRQYMQNENLKQKEKQQQNEKYNNISFGYRLVQNFQEQKLKVYISYEDKYGTTCNRFKKTGPQGKDDLYASLNFIIEQLHYHQHKQKVFQYDAKDSIISALCYEQINQRSTQQNLKSFENLGINVRHILNKQGTGKKLKQIMKYYDNSDQIPTKKYVSEIGIAGPRIYLFKAVKAVSKQILQSKLQLKNQQHD